MFADIATMMWKETRSVLQFQGRRGQMIISLVTPLVMAVFFPWRMGLDWADLYLALFIAVSIPLFVVGVLIPDSFAGERERHTLETLLASRVPDQAILIAKILTSVLMGWCLSVAVLLLSLVTLNIVHWQGQVIFYRPLVFLACLVTSLLVSLLTASLGVLFSLRAATVQAAQQNLLTSMMLPLMLLGFVPMILFSSPKGLAWMRAFLARLSADQVVWSAIGILLFVDLGLLFLNLARFRRSRLVLD